MCETEATSCSLPSSLANRASTESCPGTRDDCVPCLIPMDTVPQGMSKTQWKKKLKQLDKKKNWAIKKLEAKERKKAKQEQLREERDVLGPPPPKKNDIGSSRGAQRKRYRKMTDERASSVRVAVDCSFEQLMTSNDQLKLSKQLQRCYSANRRSVAPLQYYVTSYGGQLKAELDSRYPVTKEHEHWDIHYKSEEFIELFGKENVVYLLAESPNVLLEFDPSKVYIIGGLVDHNHHKGHCHKLAEEKGLAHVRLPISEYVQINSRRVLTINHVFEILLAFSTNGGDWKKAFYEVIPPRKLPYAAPSPGVSGSVEHDQSVAGHRCQSPSETAASIETESTMTAVEKDSQTLVELSDPHQTLNSTSNDNAEVPVCIEESARETSDNPPAGD